MSLDPSAVGTATSVAVVVIFVVICAAAELTAAAALGPGFSDRLTAMKDLGSWTLQYVGTSHGSRQPACQFVDEGIFTHSDAYLWNLLRNVSITAFHS